MKTQAAILEEYFNREGCKFVAHEAVGDQAAKVLEEFTPDYNNLKSLIP